MPVILPGGVWDAWLDPSAGDTDALRNLLASADTPDLAEYAVSTLVNKVANNVPELIAPLKTGAVDG